MTTDVNKPIYFLYRHIREDTEQVFYVGIGRKVKGNSRYLCYYRAYSLSSRNKFWDAIVNKTDFNVDILVESNDREFIGNKEKEFISMYGRRDLNKGSLVNLTDGGDGTLDPSVDVWARRMETLIKSGEYARMVERMSKYKKTKGCIGCRSTKIFVYDICGQFINEYAAIKDCIQSLKTNMSLIYKYRDKPTNGGAYIFRSSYWGTSINMEGILVISNRNKLVAKSNRSKVKTDKYKICSFRIAKGGEIITFPSLIELSNYFGLGRCMEHKRYTELGNLYKGYTIEKICNS